MPYYNHGMSKKQISGIYAIRNKVNGKVYVGSSVSIYYRWKGQHRTRLRRQVHENAHLQNAWNKYGEENFDHIILEECPEDALVEREEYWIEHYQSYDRDHGYNLVRIVEGRQVHPPTTEETRQLMSKAARQSWQNQKIRARRIDAINESITDEVREKISDHMKERWQDAEYQQQRAEIMAQTWEDQREDLQVKLKKAWKRTRQKRAEAITDEGREKMSSAAKEWWSNKSRPILQYTINGEFVREWPNQVEPRKLYGAHVTSVLTGRRKSVKGFVFLFKESGAASRTFS